MGFLFASLGSSGGQEGAKIALEGGHEAGSKASRLTEPDQQLGAANHFVLLSNRDDETETFDRGIPRLPRKLEESLAENVDLLGALRHGRAAHVATAARLARDSHPQL